MTAFASLGELAVASVEDVLVASFEFVFGRDVADGGVQADVVVMVGVFADEPPGVVEGERDFDADAFALECLVPAFDFTIRLRIVGRCFDVGHAGDADELFEVFGDELGSVVGDDARSDSGVTLAGALEDGLDVLFLHFFADFVVDDESAAAIEDGAEEVECARDVEIADVDVPMFVRQNRLNESGAFLGDVRRVAGEQASVFEDAIGAGGAAGDVLGGGRIGVEHHEGKSAIAFEGVGASEVADAKFFVVGEPMVARDPSVVFVGFSEASFPIVEFAGSDAEPREEATSGDVGLVAPVADEIDELVAGIVWHPASF